MSKLKANWRELQTTAENEILPKWFKWAWTGRGLAFTLNFVLMMQVTYFCTDILEMPAVLVGTLLLSSKVVDALTDLIFGYVIDKTHSRWGKARPYDVFVALMWLGTVLLFACPNQGVTGKAIYIFIMYALVNSVCQTFVMASDPVYLSRSVRSDKNKMSVTSFQGAFLMIGSTIVSIVMPQMIKTLGTQKSGWTIIALTFAVPLTIIGSIRMFLIPEVAVKDEEHEKTEKLSIGKAIRLAGTNKLLLVLCGLSLMNNIISSVTAATGNYYCKWILGDIGLASLISLPMMLTPVILAFTPALSRKIGTGKLLSMGLVAAVLGYIVRLIFGANIVTILIGTGLSSIGMIPIGTLLSIYEMECMDYGQKKTGVRIEGLITSIIGFFGKVGSAVGSGILGVMMGMAGYVSSESAVTQSDSALQMITILFNLVPLLVAVVAAGLSFAYGKEKKSVLGY